MFNTIFLKRRAPPKELITLFVIDFCTGRSLNLFRLHVGHTGIFSLPIITTCRADDFKQLARQVFRARLKAQRKRCWPGA